MDVEPVTPSRGFVPVESLTTGVAEGVAPPVSPSGGPAPDAPAPFVIEPEVVWSERTSLFGDAEV